DCWYERHRHWSERLLNFKPLRLRPSEYVRQHISFSVQHVERVAVELRHHMGVERIMFATDFPHIECDWPNTRPFAERLFAGVPQDETYKIAAGSVVAFFAGGDGPMGGGFEAGAAKLGPGCWASRKNIQTEARREVGARARRDPP